jgi:hypothetical protein
VSDYEDRLRMADRVDRTAKMATTYLKKASFWMHYRKETKYVPPLYWYLLDQAIETATDIIEALPDHFFEEQQGGGNFLGFDIEPHKFSLSDAPLEATEKLLAAIQARRKRMKGMRRIEALENTTGRTPEEAEAYRAKAAELRGRP